MYILYTDLYTFTMVNMECKKHRFLVVGLEKVVIRGGNCQGNRKLGAKLAHFARAILRRN